MIVYVAILGIVVLVAGRAFSGSTRMRVRTESMVWANGVAEKTGTLLKEDLAQMGAKSSMELINGMNAGDGFSLQSQVYMSAIDSSSYDLTSGDRYDQLKFRRVNYTEQGTFQRVEEITWFVDGKTLKRSCRTVAGIGDADCLSEGTLPAVEIASGVDSFKVYQAMPQNDSGFVRIFPKNSMNPESKAFRLLPYYGENPFVRVVTNPEEGAKSVKLSSFMTNYDEDLPVLKNKYLHMVLLADSGFTGDLWSYCKAFEFKLDSTTYEISFKVGDSNHASRMIIPGRDHFSVGLRIPASSPRKVPHMDDFMVYMPQDQKGSIERRIRFTVPRAASETQEPIQACVAFTFAFYSPLAGAADVVLSNVQVNEVTEMSFTIPENSASIDVSAKKMVKAFEVNLVVSKNGESGKSTLFIPVPSNGIKG